MQGQRTFKVPKLKLLDTLRANRAKHVEKHQEAETKWREAVLNKMKENLAAMENGDEIDGLLYINLQRPVLHKKSYDDVIGMLELTTEDVIEISWSDYSQYINDEWNWAKEFAATASVYLEG